MASNQPPSNIRILSLNCWGLKFIAKLRNERLTEIANQIAAADPRPDIVGLQECWTQQDYNVIREKTIHFLPYGKFYHSGIFGGGLVILSKWPIEESNMVRYPLNGRPAAFYRGDWFVGKGVACARIRIGPGRRDIAEVFCTHVTYSPSHRHTSLTPSSSTPPTKANPTTHTYATAQRKPGKSQNSCVPPPNAATSSSASEIST
jgi:sphingomyelin phosphodiesterase 2